MTPSVPSLYDNAQLNSLIGAIYDSSTEPVQWQGFLDSLTAAFPGIACAIAGFSTDIAVPIFTQSGFDDSWIEQYTAQANLINDSVKYMVDKPVGEVFGYTIIPPEEYWELNIVKNWLEPQGFGMASMAVLVSSGERFLALNVVYKKECEEAYREKVEEILRMLVGHIIRAMDIVRRASQSRIATYSLRGLCDAITLPMVATDQSGRLVFTNRSGANFLSRSDVLQVGSNGDLLANTRQSSRMLLDRIGEVAKWGTTSGLLLGGRSNNLGLCIIPLSAEDDGQSTLDQRLFGLTRIVGLLICQRRAAVLEPELLRDVFGLSDAEAQIGGLLLIGWSPEIIANKLDRSIRTVRNHIQSIYQKVDVSSQGELADALGAFRLFGNLIDSAGSSAQLS